MKDDEFAFFNQQLAAMLRDGIPLEGALRQLCQEMRAGSLRVELQSLEADLAKGTPMADALAPRQLPELYKRMILVGVKSGDLPGALTMLADYFERQNNTWTRLKSLMVYPIIVLLSAFFLSCFLSFLLGHFIWNNLSELSGFYGRAAIPTVSVGLWIPPILFGLALVATFAGLIIAPTRRMLRWQLPAFREASLAQVASVIWLMLKNGVALDDTLATVEQLEKGTGAQKEIAGWRRQLASGRGKFYEMTGNRKVFPPLFIWTVAQSGEDLVSGFKRTAELYQARAIYRTEMFLYSALPCSIILIATLILSQIQPVFRSLTLFITALGGNGGGD
jgi:type IV pilus assembly protein PilC